MTDTAIEHTTKHAVDLLLHQALKAIAATALSCAEHAGCPSTCTARVHVSHDTEASEVRILLSITNPADLVQEEGGEFPRVLAQGYANSSAAALEELRQRLASR